MSTYNIKGLTESKVKSVVQNYVDECLRSVGLRFTAKTFYPSYNESYVESKIQDKFVSVSGIQYETYFGNSIELVTYIQLVFVQGICQGCLYAKLHQTKFAYEPILVKPMEFGIGFSALTKNSKKKWYLNELPLYTSIEDLVPKSNMMTMVKKIYDTYMPIEIARQELKNKMDAINIEQELLDRSSNDVDTYQITYSDSDIINFKATGDYLALLGFRLVTSESDPENTIVDARYLIDEWDNGYLKMLIAQYPDIVSLKKSPDVREWRDSEIGNVTRLINLSTHKRLLGR